MTTKRTLTYTMDPGHGWLSVSHDDLRTLSLAHDISTCSFMNRTRVYLEGDDDANKYLRAAKAAGWLVSIKESYVDHTFIRHLAHYNPYWIDNPPTTGQIVTNNNVPYVVRVERDNSLTLYYPDGKNIAFTIPSNNPFDYISPAPEVTA